ncbi:MAG TPA: hypothetical protein VFT64_10050 [Rickettsiales bacterium]|nr:hypothetical protein [Rickettsiales bacterium]
MLETVKLLLPALVPSWRFFDRIAASPRVEFRAGAGEWREFCPRPAYLSLGSMLKRLFWNPRWNESLFMVSCAERLLHDGEAHCARAIADRIRTQFIKDGTQADRLQFRLVFIHREGERLQKEVTFVSPVYPVAGGGV